MGEYRSKQSMKRMTYWCDDGKGGGEWRANVRGMEVLGAEIDRLAAYEDIGTIDHLRELAQAEQDGRLVVLPCKVGDTVYMPDPEKIIIPVRVQGIAITASGQTILHFGGYPVEYAWGNEIGKTIHLTREEAESALKAQKGGGDAGSADRRPAGVHSKNV